MRYYLYQPEGEIWPTRPACVRQRVNRNRVASLQSCQLQNLFRERAWLDSRQMRALAVLGAGDETAAICDRDWYQCLSELRRRRRRRWHLPRPICLVCPPSMHDVRYDFDDKLAKRVLQRPEYRNFRIKNPGSVLIVLLEHKKTHTFLNRIAELRICASFSFCP